MYEQMIRDAMALLGRADAADPRHVEAYMRLGHGTLDGLGARGFLLEVEVALSCIATAGVAQAESLAKSYAL